MLSMNAESFLVYTQNIDAIESECGLLLGVQVLVKGESAGAYFRTLHTCKRSPSDAILSVDFSLSRHPAVYTPLHGTLQSLHY
jgi:hypothetical protein